jgi:hypothetical protein
MLFDIDFVTKRRMASDIPPLYQADIMFLNW